MRVLTIILVSVVLTACAATPKPTMSDEDYTKYAKVYLDIYSCNLKGWITPDTAASGKLILDMYVSRYSFDSEMFNRRVSWLDKRESKPSQEYCNKTAFEIQTEKQRLAKIRESDNVPSQQIVVPQIRNTYCNRIGTQTICNTY